MSKRKQVTSGQVAELTTWTRRLTPEEYQTRRSLLRRVTDPKCELGPKLFYPFKDERPLEHGWNLMREGALCVGKIDIAKIQLVPFHKNGEEWISGDEMLRRARDARNFPGCADWSQHHAEQLLERASELPEEWAAGFESILLFPDTQFLDEFDNRRVPYLVGHVDGWLQRWDFIEYDLDHSPGFGRSCRFLRLCK